MSFPIRFVLLLLALMATSPLPAAFTTVGDFLPAEDLGSGFQHNAHNTSIAAFEAGVEADFLTGFGGVIDFESANGSLDMSNRGLVIGTYATGTKFINLSGTFTSTVGTTQAVRFANGVGNTNGGSNGVLASGSNGLSNRNSPVVDMFLTGALDSGEAITSVGFVLQRLGSDTRDDFVLTANFSDGTDFTFPGVNYTIGTGTQGFSYLVDAPTGSSIDSLEFVANSDPTDSNAFVIDDFAFRTSAVAVPEPSGVLAIAVICMVGARRRLKRRKIAPSDR